MNTADKAYNELLEDVLENGETHDNRTGVNTLSVFGRQKRFNLKDGFPILTGKKVWYKGILHEVLWFLGATPPEYERFEQTNIKYLVDNGVNIWNEWPYKKYVETAIKAGQEYLTQDEFVEEIKRNDDFARMWGNLGPVYGAQWTNWKSTKREMTKIEDDKFQMVNVRINQIQQMVDRLKTNPDCRRIIISGWNPADIPEMLLPPCHYSFQFKSEWMKMLERQTAFLKHAKENQLNLTGMGIDAAMEHYKFPKRKLHLLWNQRSVDVFLGLAFNIGSYATILEMFAQVTDHVPAELIFSGGDVHIYNNHMDQVKEQLSREPRALPHLVLNKNIKNIFDFRYDDFQLVGYNPHPAIKGEVAV